MTDINTILHCHFDDDFVDTSKNENVLTKVGTVTFEGAVFDNGAKFNGGYLTAPDAPYWQLNQFTIDFRIKFNIVQNAIILIQRSAASVYWILHYYNGKLVFQIVNGSILTEFATTWAPVVDTFYDVELVRNGNDYFLFVDGVKISAPYSSAISIPNIGAPLSIGADAYASGGGAFNGVLDELRISDIARHTANFTPETSPFDDYEPPPAPALLSAAEYKNREFVHKAALLDPACGVYLRGMFDVTVPEGETWYIFNAWFVNIGNGGAYFHRNLGVDAVQPIPAGTRLVGVNVSSLLFYGNPSLVTEDERYEEAEDLYYSRIGQIKDLTIQDLNMYRPAGSVAPAFAYFPETMTNAVVVAISTHGGSFVSLDGGSIGGVPTPERITNTLDELSDGHEIRFTKAMIQPIRYEMFDRAYMQTGNRDGVYYAPHTEETFGVVHFVELPIGW